MMEAWPARAAVAAIVVMASLAVSAALIVILRPWLARYALARPNARSSHREPTPQGGGIAVVAATLAVSLVALAMSPGAQAWQAVFTAFSAAILLALVGAIDDIRPLPASFRLALHALAVAAVVHAMPPEMKLFQPLPLWAERTLLILAGVWFVNLVNFMDGLDWMTVAEFGPVTLGLALIGFMGGLPDYATLIALALLGALIGFAPFNKPVARLFLGDVGSLPIGLLAGWLLMLLAAQGHYAAALILPLYYLADATITLLRRLAKGERVWIAHRTHFYQRATDRGLTVREVILRVFGVNLVLCGLALACVAYPGAPFGLAALAVACAAVAALLYELTRRDPAAPPDR
jgi:UDP-N-acetylmuramyl pentapeptide phosphotransferase/UDP-N-acetylglucosamine-1-phosphate transferase